MTSNDVIQNQLNDRDLFERDGYLIVRGLLRDKEIDRLREATADAITNRIQPIVFEDKVEEFDAAVPAMYKDDEGRVFRRLSRVLQRGGVFEEIICGPIAQEAAKLLGTTFSVCLNRHNMLMLKAPHNMAPVHWHQDAPVWDEGTYDHVSVIVPLDDFLPENGGLQVVPGSHKIGPLATGWNEHLAAVQERCADLIAREATLVDLKVGDVLFFKGLLLHGSGGNPSDMPRRSITIALHPGDLREVSARRGEGAPEVRVVSVPVAAQ
jgi:ectoine hydroxylase-related dioxygenase (phytanoyl-CoA dioxygenase family)